MENNALETRTYSITAPKIFFESFEKLFDVIIKDASNTSNFKRLDSDSKQPDEAMIVTDKYCKDSELKYGLFGQHFKLPLNHKFENGDIIECGHKDLKPLSITNDPVEYVVEHYNDGTKLEYWLHTVKITTNIMSGYFYPRKFLLPGTRFRKM